MPTLRFLDAGDVAALRVIRIEALTNHPDAFHGSPEAWAALPDAAVESRIRDNRVVGAFSDDALVGIAMLALTARPQPKRAHRAEIWNVYVKPAHRGDGTAGRLIEALIEEARRLGLEGLILTVAAHNERARLLYERRGFRVIGTEPGALRLPDGNFGDEHTMLLRL